ncbi:hypothetical protein GCM10014719_34680 [Planomonospora parontospora subsp. antibiotica]|nr:hypothetical protein GCM10014719_34680 [Planomonospora parontospora subsp. antibiotica]GII17712.1 hypothetical protein Ppa05_44380 [Planomonospora parontospora subsp. antibiotica]
MAGCLALALFASGLWWSGALTPHIRWSLDGFFLHAQVDENGVLSTDIDIELENEGPTPFTFTGISAEIPGLRFLPADEARNERFTVTVAGGGMEYLRRRVVITDCAAVPHEPRPVTFTYRTWLRSGSAEAMWNSWRLSGPAGSVLVAWQRGLAGKVCNGAVNPDQF